MCLLLILSNKLDLNQETRFTILSIPISINISIPVSINISIPVSITIFKTRSIMISLLLSFTNIYPQNLSKKAEFEIRIFFRKLRKMAFFTKLLKKFLS